MNTKNLLCLVIFCLLLSSISVAQLKYIGENKGVTVFTASYSSTDITKIVGGEIDFSTNGKIGFGAFFNHGSNPGSNLFGIQCEIPLNRPVKNLEVGINLMGAAGLLLVSVTTVDSYNVPFLGSYNQNVENSYSGHFGALGIEVYLHIPGNSLKIEPFAQISNTFSNLSVGGNEVSGSQFSLTLGGDVFLLNSLHNNLILTSGIVIAENTNNSFALNVSFAHAFN